MRSYVFGGGDGAPRRIDVLASRNRRPFKKRGAKWEKALAWAVAAWTLGMAPTAFAHPILDAKDAAVSISGTTNMNITSGATNNLIKWVDFSIGKNESVTFDAKNYLNYVTGSARSEILGTLTGGRNIYLVNPNGILIGDGATVNVGSLHLSTRTLTDSQFNDFKAGNNPLTGGTIGGDVINMGKLNATSISVEGNNITFKNVADVTKNTLNDAGEIIGTTQNTAVTLTANSGGEIHIGSASGGASGYTTSGTVYNYKLVNDAAGLQAMKDNLSGNYMLAGDIPNVGEFSPVGKDFNMPFKGRFDGLNYKVRDLHLLVDGVGAAGLFGVNNGVVENLEVAGTTTVENNSGTYLDIGAVAGWNYVQGILRNVRNTSTINASGLVAENFGGVAGMNKGTIDRAYNMGALTADSDKHELSLGGIAGKNGDGGSGGVITNAFNQGALSDTGTGSDKWSYVGGVVGYMDSGSIENAYNSGVLTTDTSKTSNSYVGGVVGYLHDATVQKTYNSGALNGHNDVGGIVGNEVTWYDDSDYPNPLADSYSIYHPDRQNQGPYGQYDVRDGNELTNDNKKTQGTYKGFQFTDTESQKAVWRIYDGSTMPLLTAFLTRADQSKGTTEYNGTATGDVGANYAATTYNGEQAQIGGLNYVKDYTIVTPKNLTVSFAAISKIYDGTTNATAGTATLDGKIDGDDVTLATGLTAAYADKNAGTGNKTVNYTGIALSGEQAKNYNLTSTTYDNTTSTISKADITVSVGDITKTYDGTTNTDNTTDATGGAFTVTSGTLYDGDTISGTKAFDTKDAGTGNKTVTLSDVTISDAAGNADNYNISTVDNTTSTINQRPLTVEFGTAAKNYDGTTTATLPATYTLDGRVNLDTENVDIIPENLSIEYEDKNAGDGKTVYYEGIALTGTTAGNYALTSTTATGLGSIHKAGAHITAFADTTKTYDGTTAAPLGAATLSGIIAADLGKVGVTGTAVYDGKDVGDHTVNYSGLSLTGAEAGNYQLSTFSLSGNGTITRRPLWLVANPVTITEGEATPTTWSGSVTGFVAGEELGVNDVYFFALDNPAASAVGSYSVTGTLKIGDNDPATSGDYGDNYTFTNAAANATAFTVKAKQMTPKDIIENATENPGAAQEYTNVVGSIESGAATAMPTTNVLPTASVIPTNSVLPTGNDRPTGNTQQTGSNQPTEPAAQESTSASGEQNEAQEQNGLLPTQQATGGQPAAGGQENHLDLTLTDINMPKSMSVEALAATLNGEPTQQGAAPAASNTPATEPTVQNAPTTGAEAQPTSTQGAAQEGDEEA